MRAALLALMILLPALASATDVQGTLTHNTVWTSSGSPYVLKGDVTVAWGVRLTLEPGVQVIASSTDALKSGVDAERVELIVDGTLVVRGTPEQPVTLSSQGGDGSWYGIRVRGGRGTLIDHAVITQAHQGIALGMSAAVMNTSVSAAEKDCLRVSWGSATLERNDLSGCGRREPEVRDEAVARDESRVRSPYNSKPAGQGMGQDTAPAPTRPSEQAGMPIATLRPAGDAVEVLKRKPSSGATPPGASRAEGARSERPTPGVPAPPRPPGSKTANPAGGTPSHLECTHEPQVLEPPECPGIRRWRQNQEQLGDASGRVWERGPEPPVPRQLERVPRTAPG
ncbi:hypothetical protein [Vitiosangium sp. GDMCC 1.1324]|uniref:hypothetical protein n=1 Tax=Vitiosangium sp. (strain GDMCC 1.1324) TaxID=2138576 RepID=UPI000D3417D7|nr:hypothetical protein [Vitiosangium sp. GDMCC 1.1324]PTL77964.1 hypothetical protein DAT35_40760 [Vitiosangium sp. GDMCC 1.1324]